MFFKKLGVIENGYNLLVTMGPRGSLAGHPAPDPNERIPGGWIVEGTMSEVASGPHVHTHLHMHANINLKQLC